jgi:hypothetical protein
MAYAFFYDVPSNEEIYGKVKAEIGEPDPEGLILQMVVKRDGGLRHYAVWESKEQWTRFQQEHVGPAVARVLESLGIPAPADRPALEEMELVDVITSP